MQSQPTTINIDSLLQQHTAVASQSAKQAVSRFALLFARRFTKKCIEVAQMRGRLTDEDIRYVYEAEKGIKSPANEGELIEKMTRTIDAVNKTALKDLEFATNEDGNNPPPLSNVQTVRIGSQPYSGFPTGLNFQFCFEKLPS